MLMLAVQMGAAGASPLKDAQTRTVTSLRNLGPFSFLLPRCRFRVQSEPCILGAGRQLAASVAVRVPDRYSLSSVHVFHVLRIVAMNRAADVDALLRVRNLLLGVSGSQSRSLSTVCIIRLTVHLRC